MSEQMNDVGSCKLETSNTAKLQNKLRPLEATQSRPSTSHTLVMS